MAEFAHESESQLASLFDAYGIRWEYEPTTFVLESDADGNPLEAFTPDFYLVDFDTYVEVTTMRQPLVTRKNRKVRKLRTRYPNVRVKMLHRRATLGLLAKYSQESVAA